MARFHPLRKFACLLGVAFGVAAVACLLPERPYERWQLLDGTIHGRSRWIYERTHFDPRPIDVMFVGPSRIARAIDPLQLQAQLSKSGQPVHVVNFSLPEGGRNINDVVYLPFRQLQLFAGYVAPQTVGLTDHFDPARYDPDPANPTSVLNPDGSVAEDWTKAASPAELQRGIHKLEAGMTPPILPASLADVEFGDDRHYVRRIVAAAQRKGVKVAFLFIPYCTGPSTVQEETFYRQYGPVWNAGFISSRPDLYADYGHLTVAGGEVLTTWITPMVAAAIQPPEAKP
jgi:hypothetical protein